MAVDILPASLPREASEHFSQALTPYLRALVRDEKSGEEADALDRATIARDGKLTERFTWLKERIGKGERKKRVLVLGSGMVARPAVDELAKRADVHVIVGQCSKRIFFSWLTTRVKTASDSLTDAQRLTAPHANALPKEVDVVRSPQVIEGLVKEADVVVRCMSTR